MRSGAGDVPSRFRRRPKTQTGRARRAFRRGAPGDRLMSSLDRHAYLFTLTPADVGLPEHLEQPSNLYQHAALETIFGALERTFSGPFYAVLEVGEGTASERGRLHIHAVAHRDDGPPDLRRDSERHKPVTDARGLYRYLAKAPERYSLEAHLDLSSARTLSSTGRPPRTRRHYLGPSRLAWAEANALYDLTLFSLESFPWEFWERGASASQLRAHGAIYRAVNLDRQLRARGGIYALLGRPQRRGEAAPRRLDHLSAWKASGGPPATAPPPTGAAA